MAKTNKNEEYVVEKEVWAETKSGDSVLVGFIRSRDDRIFYFNPIPRLGLKWIDSLKDYTPSDKEDDVEF